MAVDEFPIRKNTSFIVHLVKHRLNILDITDLITFSDDH